MDIVTVCWRCKDMFQPQSQSRGRNLTYCQPCLDMLILKGTLNIPSRNSTRDGDGIAERFN